MQLRYSVFNPFMFLEANPFMLLEVETELIIQDGLEVTISWKTGEVDKTSAGAERILSEFIQNKNGWEGSSSLTI